MLVILNNKNHLKKDEFVSYINDLSSIKSNSFILCPSACYLSLCQDMNFELGGQNVSRNNEESLTGEITAEQLKSLDVSYCLVGHSERRVNLHETSQDINCKLKSLLAEKITPILCIGETETEYKENRTKEVLLKEIQEAIENISYADQQKIIIAYEPIWAIENDIIPSPSEITSIIKFIKSIFPSNIIVYGGGINEDNIMDITSIPILDGLLLGRLSCNSTTLKNIIQRIG